MADVAPRDADGAQEPSERTMRYRARMAPAVPLSDPAFWAWYLTGEPALDRASRFEMRVACSPHHSIIVEADPGVVINLLLTERGEKRVLGWQDGARGHALALRWEEAQAITDRAEDKALSTLLLVPFVGTPEDDADEIEERRASAAAAFRDLHVLDEAEAERLLVEAIPCAIREPDYAWSRDPDLGWVYGGEYPCYSIRNREHSAGDEGEFPFAAMRQLRKALGLDP